MGLRPMLQAAFLLLACNVGPGRTFSSTSSARVMDPSNSFLYNQGKQGTCCCDAGSRCPAEAFRQSGRLFWGFEKDCSPSWREIPNGLEKSRESDSFSVPAGLQKAIPPCVHYFLHRCMFLSQSWKLSEECLRRVADKQISARTIQAERTYDDALGQSQDILQGTRSRERGNLFRSIGLFSALENAKIISVLHHGQDLASLDCHKFAASPLLRLRGSGREQRKMERKTAAVRDRLVFIS
jgi:hypothetical protein